MHLELLQLFRLGWSAVIMPGSGSFNCMLVVGSSQRWDADPTGHITTEPPASLDTRKHENHWNNYTHYDTSFSCGRTETVSISKCLWLHFQLESSISMHACVQAYVSTHHLKNIANTWGLFSTGRNGVNHHPHTRVSPSFLFHFKIQKGNISYVI